MLELAGELQLTTSGLPDHYRIYKHAGLYTVSKAWIIFASKLKLLKIIELYSIICMSQFNIYTPSNFKQSSN